MAIEAMSHKYFSEPQDYNPVNDAGLRDCVASPAGALVPSCGALAGFSLSGTIAFKVLVCVCVCVT